MTKKKTPIKKKGNFAIRLLTSILIIGITLLIIYIFFNKDIEITKGNVTFSQAVEIVDTYPEVKLYHLLHFKDKARSASTENGGWYIEIPTKKSLIDPNNPDAVGRYFVDPKSGISERVWFNIFGKTIFFR